MKKTKADKKTVEFLTKENYDNWIQKIRDVLNKPGSPLSLDNEGTWTVKKRKEIWQKLGARLFDEHLDRFKKIAVDVLREPDPQFQLPPEERYMANIKGKTLTHSQNLRKGLAESLALLGSQPKALKNCSRGKAETVAICSIREIFKNSDWVLWGSLNNLLPTLAEAAPEEFLNAAENALRKRPCPFDKLFSQEGKGLVGSNYLTGLLWALETLAWGEKYLVQTTVILGNLASHDPGGNWGNRPANSLMTIFLPWYPQTIASIEKRKAAVLTLQNEFPAVAWKLLLNLLPNQHQTSSGSHKPDWRKIIPDNWEKGVTNKEYWEQISAYTDLAVEMAKDDITKLKELIIHLDDLTKPSFEKLLAYLGSAEVVNRLEEERTPLWIALVDFTHKHRLYQDSDWALKPETVDKIEQIAKKLEPKEPQNLYARLFNRDAFSLYEEKGNWEEQEKQLEEKRRNAIREILKHGGLEAVFQFAEIVNFPDKVGFSLGFIAEDNTDRSILPKLLETDNKKLAQFATGFIWGRYVSRHWEWIEQINKTNWSNIQIGKFLSHLPFTQKTWHYSKELLGEHEVEYWSRAGIYPHNVEDDPRLAIEKLIQYDRPYTAIDCLNRMLHEKKLLDKSIAVNALLKAVSSKESVEQIDRYSIIELIKVLQDDPETNQDNLFSIEWAYLPLLTGPGKSGSPKLLEHKLANEPGFFCEMLRLIYKSKKESKSKKKPTEQEKLIAQNAWHLLNDWETIPGKQKDGSFSENKFNEWLDKVKKECKQSGHFEVALIAIGKALIHYVPDPDGFWIHRAIAKALNDKDAEEMRHGFELGIFNSRGAHYVDPTGEPEKELVAMYRKQADDVENASFYRLANTFKSLAKLYEHELERIIEKHKKGEL